MNKGQRQFLLISTNNCQSMIVTCYPCCPNTGHCSKNGKTRSIFLVSPKSPRAKSTEINCHYIVKFHVLSAIRQVITEKQLEKSEII